MVRWYGQRETPESPSEASMMSSTQTMASADITSFLVSLRDPAVADVSNSNGFESDNDANGSTNTPITSAVFSNVTFAGPMVTHTTTV